MQIIIDEIDYMFYADVILSPKEISKIMRDEMATGSFTFKRRKCYIGIRQKGVWDDGQEEDESTEES